jgi:nucleotide-binding universal stress UspA family protein
MSSTIGARPRTRTSGAVLIAYDGSPGAERAVADAARVLAARRALVLVVWRSGLGFELLELPTVSGLPPAPLDIRAALELDESQYEGARRLANQGTGVAREVGFEAEALVVAEAPETPVAHTIARVARERRSDAVVVARHGSVTRELISRAPCPVMVAATPET